MLPRVNYILIKIADNVLIFPVDGLEALKKSEADEKTEDDVRWKFCRTRLLQYFIEEKLSGKVSHV